MVDDSTLDGHMDERPSTVTGYTGREKRFEQEDYEFSQGKASFSARQTFRNVVLFDRINSSPLSAIELIPLLFPLFTLLQKTLELQELRSKVYREFRTTKVCSFQQNSLPPLQEESSAILCGHPLVSPYIFYLRRQSCAGKNDQSHKLGLERSKV